ncbi:hypothetical protein VTK26DRAFT_6064 [Humicola hyalothermophila]
MVEMDDIESLLQTGSWRTSRSRSRDPRDSHRQPYDYPGPNIGVARTAEQLSRSKRPPLPSVEDEQESLAKEHIGSVVTHTSDEEPKNRGDIDQQPILLPVHEHNTERRFVIVPGAASEDKTTTDQARYEANTCRKYILVTPEKGSEKRLESSAEEGPKRGSGKGVAEKDGEEKQRSDLPKRKSHQDLPRLNTDFKHTELPIRRSSSRRDRDKVVVEQDPRRYDRERTSPRPSDDDYLSPSSRQTAGKREMAYWDSRSDSGRRSGRSPSARRDARIEIADGRRPHRSPSNYLATPSPHRRSSSTNSVPIRNGQPSERPKSYIQPYGYGDPEAIMAFMAPGDDFMARSQVRRESPPRRSRYGDSPPHPRGAREMPGASPNRRRQSRYEARDRDGYSSDDSYKERRSARAEHPYSPRTAFEPEYPPLLSPDQVRQPNHKLGPVPPLIAAQSTQLPDYSPLPSSRSATFPTDRNGRRSERSSSPSPPTSTSPSRRPARNRPARDASIDSPSDGSASLPPSLPNSSGQSNPVETIPSAWPVAALAREDSAGTNSPVYYWQPGRSNTQAIIDSDGRCPLLSQLPDCRWKYPTVARHCSDSDQFLTLKRAENFIICPDCYGAVFANSEFQHLFVPAPIRSGGQLISCDFGSSPWYRIAYLMTRKQRYPDLRLLQGIASVAARSQACAGSQLATRIWYSMMAPNSRRPIQTFNVCLGCAKMVEVLLPNLAGVFVPLDSHEPTRGVCELHFAPDRKRFFTYLGEMEATSDQALKRRTAPDITELADRIRSISLHEECLRNTPIPNRKWHVLQRVPDFTVCEECFDAVVWPMIEAGDPSEVPINFYKARQLRPVASCQLYSERMRKVFLEACEYNDFEYLAARVARRLRVLAEVKARYNELQREDQDDPAVREELGVLARRFKEVE